MNGHVFLNVAAIALRYPIGMYEAMIMALGDRFGPIWIHESNATNFIRNVFWFLCSAFGKMFEVYGPV